MNSCLGNIQWSGLQLVLFLASRPFFLIPMPAGLPLPGCASFITYTYIESRFQWSQRFQLIGESRRPKKNSKNFGRPTGVRTLNPWHRMNLLTNKSPRPRCPTGERERRRENKSSCTTSWQPCRDHCHCPAPFTYFVWQKGYFQPFPLTVGIQNPLVSLLSC